MELMVGLYFCCTFAELAALAENAPKPSSARRTPARTINRPIKMRGSRKANCETDFFFMSGRDVDKIWAKWSLAGSAEVHLRRIGRRRRCRRLPPAGVPW